jgi:uroporphyrin-3 C-methyltransferase
VTQDEERAGESADAPRQQAGEGAGGAGPGADTPPGDGEHAGGTPAPGSEAPPGAATPREPDIAPATKPDTTPGELPGTAPADAPASRPQAAQPPPSSTAPPAGAGPLPLIALALAAAAALLALWGIVDGQRRDSDTLQRLTGLEALSGRDSTTLEQLSAALERQVELELKAAATTLRGERQAAVADLRERIAAVAGDAAAVQRAQADTAGAVAALRDGTAGRITSLASDLGALEDQLARQRDRLSEFQQVSAGDRDGWLLAEANYLLRLANQRLVMTADTASAEALLRSADAVLRELDDPALRVVRQAVAEDLAAVRAVPSLDREGTYLRLSALVERVPALEVFETPSLPDGDAPPPMQGDWQTRLRQGYERALAKLSDYVIVRRRDEPVEVLMDPQWESLVRQNLRMLLEQAQLALLSANPRLYRESIARSAEWVREFEASDPEGAAAMLEELEELAGVRVTVAVPDASDSLAALQSVLASRQGRDRG